MQSNIHTDNDNEFSMFTVKFYHRQNWQLRFGLKLLYQIDCMCILRVCNIWITGIYLPYPSTQYFARIYGKDKNCTSCKPPPNEHIANGKTFKACHCFALENLYVCLFCHLPYNPLPPTSTPCLRHSTCI